jgi:hypothetical protein
MNFADVIPPRTWSKSSSLAMSKLRTFFDMESLSRKNKIMSHWPYKIYGNGGYRHRVKKGSHLQMSWNSSAGKHRLKSMLRLAIATIASETYLEGITLNAGQPLSAVIW